MKQKLNLPLIVVQNICCKLMFNVFNISMLFAEDYLIIRMLTQNDVTTAKKRKVYSIDT